MNFVYNDYVIEVVDVRVKEDGRVDFTYDRIYRDEGSEFYEPVSRHGVIVRRDQQRICSVLLACTGGATGVYDDAALVDRDNLIVRCCNTVFSLALPHLTINWQMKPDWATCFGVYYYEGTYISWGEMSISRIDRNGQQLWSFGAADTFVSSNGGNPFELYPEYIDLLDFNGNRYRIDYDGRLI